MQRLEVNGAVRPIYGSLGVKRLSGLWKEHVDAGRSENRFVRCLIQEYCQILTSCCFHGGWMVYEFGVLMGSYWQWKLKVKVKVKLSRYTPDVSQRVGRGITLLFHDRGTRRGWVVSSTPRPHFTPRKDPVPILQEAGWASGPVWTGGKSRPHRDSIPDRPARSRCTDWPRKLKDL